MDNPFLDAICAATKPDSQVTDLSTSKLRQICREGNPFPLVARQWPETVVTDPAEAEFFEGEIGDPLNPCLRFDPWQRNILQSAFDPVIGEIFVKGCTGAGKGAVMSILACLLLDVTDPCKINVTSDSFANALDNLFGEIKDMWLKMADPSPARVTVRRIEVHPLRYIRVHNPSKHSKGESFSGAHSKGKTIYFLDEASAIPDVHYTNALKNAKLIIAASNPRVTEGWFRDGYKPLRSGSTKQEMDDAENTTGRCVGRLRKRLAVTVAGTDCANVRYGRLKDPVAPILGIEIDGKKYESTESISEEHFEKVKALVPGQIDLAQYQSIIHTSKETWEVECFAHARFPSEDPVRQAILSSHLPRHFAAHRQSHQDLRVTCFGLDVSRSLGGDYTSLAAGGVKGCKKIFPWQSNSHNEHVDRILNIATLEYNIDLRQGNNPVCIEMGGGYGAGVADPLKRLGVWVIEFVPQGRPVTYPDIYSNQRTEGYMMLSSRLDPNGNWAGSPFALPESSELEAELIAPLKRMVRGGTVVQLENKEDIIKRLGRSPDKADSLVCLFRAVFERYKLHSLFQKPVKLTMGTLSDLSSSLSQSSEASDDSDEPEALVDSTLSQQTEEVPFMTEEPPDPADRLMNTLADAVGMLDHRRNAEETKKPQSNMPKISAEERSIMEMEARRARKLRRYLEE